MSHAPVLVAEMLAALSPKEEEIYVDATFGGGGYSRAILEAASCRVAAFDRDPEAVSRGKSLEKDFPGRFQIQEGTFSQIDALLKAVGLSKVHGFVFDLGVSSDQIDSPERGFSFRFDGPLDMRMSKKGPTAADVVNTYSEQELADIIFRYGEEKKARAIARKIVAARQKAPFETTRQLADLAASIVRGGKDGQNPATLTFQALRIFVNNELMEIYRGLKIAEDFLVPGGRLVVVTFHSLEDRLVKQFLKARQRDGKGNGKGDDEGDDQEGDDKGKRKSSPYSGSRHLPAPLEASDIAATFIPTFEKGKRTGVGSKGQTPTDSERRLNPRARSARLRTAIRLALLGGPSRHYGGRP